MMMLWLMSAALTIAVLLSIAIPVWRRSRRDEDVVGEFEHDVAVYRHQLQELAAETERGVISETDATQARTEIARRLLAAEDKAAGEKRARDSRERRFATIFLVATLVAFVPGLTYILYTDVGSPHLPSQPLEARLESIRERDRAADNNRVEMAELVERAEAHLASNPDDGEGWNVLAPVYFRLGQPDKAEEAFRNAIRLSGESASKLSGLGETLFAQSSSIVRDDARQAFEKAIELDESDARARFYLGLASLQSGSVDEGRAAWVELAADTNADPDWVGAAQEGIRRLDTGDMTQIPGMAETASIPPAAPGMPELDQDTIEGASQMDADAQAEMIRGMVESLDARLRDNPDDIDGWMRLIRAHMVMGNTDDAQDALNRAIENGAQNTEQVTLLKGFAEQFGLEAPGS